MQTTKLELLEYLKKNDLLRAALTIGKIHDANFDEACYREKILEIAARIWHRVVRAKHDPILKAESISLVLYDIVGIRGRSEKYKKLIDDPSQFFLHELIRKKEGSPLIITVLYKILADQVGLNCVCFSLPTQYYLKVDDVSGEFYIDPFDNGRLLTKEEFQRKLKSSIRRNLSFSVNLFEQTDCYQLVGRLVQRLKQIYILKGKALEALRAVEILASIFPFQPEHKRDRGILYCEVEYFSRAIEDLNDYLKKKPEADDVKEIKKLTMMLRGYQEIIN